MANKPGWAGPALAGLLGASALAAACGANAQALTDEAVVRGMNVWKNVGNCARCHAWNGLGNRVEEEEGRGLKSQAPPLVKTALDAPAIDETVRCGRPGSVMPRHDERAWKDFKCFGLGEADIGKDAPDRAPRSLSDQQVKDVVAYIIAFYKSGEMTYDKCVAYYGGPTRTCDSYKK